MMRAVDFARLAAASYNDVPTVGDPDSASRMHVYTVGGEVVHVFRGTDDFAASIADLGILTTNVPGLGEIHSGFYDALHRILDRCFALPRPSAIAGHSLGAAMAQIYSALFALQGVQIPCYAFEPPRVCADATMRGLFLREDVPVYATRNGNDIVTQVPPELSQAWPLLQIGTPSSAFDNVTDHMIENVILALPQ